MNILQVLPELNVGGVETGTLDLAKYLVRGGHRAVVVSNGGSLVKELESDGAVHYQLPVHKKSLFTMIKMVGRLTQIIRKEKIDIVHARSRVPAWIAYFAARRTHTVFITTCHGYYRKHLFSRVMAWSKRVIVLSNVIARHMIDDFGAPHERIKLVPRSVDLEKFKYVNPKTKRKDAEFNVGIIGRLSPIKGHLHFIRAMAKVARVAPNLKIWIVGDTHSSRQAYKEQIQILVKRLGLWDSTQFLGTQRDIPEILSHLDLLVLSTVTHEAFGRVIIEAQAAGVPVVATEVGGVVDVVENNKTGLLVPPADPNQMAEAAIKIFKDQELAFRLAESAYKKVVEEYNVELMVKNTLNVYKEALGNFKILIIKFSSLGDIILSTAALRQIRKKFDSSYKISFLIGKESRDALLRCPYIDELFVVDFKDKDRGMPGFLKLSHNLMRKHFDIVIDLQNNRKSHILAYLTRSLKRYGYNNKKLGFLLNHSINDGKPAIDPVAHQFRILKMLDIELEDKRLELWPSSDDEHYIQELLSRQWLSPVQKIIGINISASPRWASKNWPLAHMAELLKQIGQQDMRAVITGTQGDLAAAQQLVGLAKNTKVINACGKTSINQLACLIKRCAVFISGDSSSLHIAQAMNTPFIALFGPTDPRRHLIPSDNGILISKSLECSPCYKSKCPGRECMELIKPEEVLAAVSKLLKR